IRVKGMPVGHQRRATGTANVSWLLRRRTCQRSAVPFFQQRRVIMHIQMRPLADLKPYERNPRHNDDAVDAVAASIRAFGFRQPIVVDEEGVIIVGHTRYKAAVKLGLEQVPVHVAIGLSPAQAKAYRIADNQTATLSSWDDDKLSRELAQLQSLDFDLN